MYVNIIKQNTGIVLTDINLSDMEEEMYICDEIKNNIPLVSKLQYHGKTIIRNDKN